MDARGGLKSTLPRWLKRVDRIPPYIRSMKLQFKPDLDASQLRQGLTPCSRKTASWAKERTPRFYGPRFVPVNPLISRGFINRKLSWPART